MYHFDHQGTTQCLTDSTGAVTDRFASDAWGAPVKRFGNSINRQWYVGNWGYYYGNVPRLSVRKRHYTPSTGAFASADPLEKHSGYRYLYGNASPAKYVDPSGLIVARDRIIDVGSYSAGKGGYVYTCGCGWVDTSHSTGYKQVWRVERELWEIRKTRSGRTTITTDIGRPWPGSQSHFSWEPGRLGYYPPTVDRAAKYIAYVSYWEFENRQSIYEVLAHSSYSYEDLVSNWIGIMAAYDRWGRKHPNPRKAIAWILDRCGAVSQAEAEALYGCMERACKERGMCHQNVKVKPGREENPISQAKLFHLDSAVRDICPCDICHDKGLDYASPANIRDLITPYVDVYPPGTRRFDEPNRRVMF